ncbi:MAG TPA: DUF3455 domain-containing protein [Amycolatopsis sp.]|uniref:DUF3455 domain-containing protein n=1 Tax=Amycolatopsis sp. TaxID=37632 RepID=UPI002B48CCC6|nr:DUF3455 domain-containing protein [Amycolatopsis sp.]HKS44071.1 DUF3455 domain-containing protein [Amycolatopsis sp.]
MRHVLVALLTTVLMAGAAAGSASAHPEDRPVPPQLRVPDGNQMIASMSARGVQTYQCANNVWTFVQPDAILEYRGLPQVLHSRGPVWTSVLDGSSVTGTAIANSPVTGTIPELLLKSTGNRGPGLLAKVTYVQRLATRGGAAPAGSCEEGTTTSVPYTANYLFWAP